MIKCRECGGMYKSLSTHIKTHGLNKESYQEKYPGAPMMSESVKKRNLEILTERNKSEKMREITRERNKSQEMRDAVAKRNKDPEFREKVRAGLNTPEYREKKSRIQSRISTEMWKDPEYGRKVSEGISKSMKEFYKTPRGLERLEEMSRSTSKSMKELWKDPEYRRKVSKSTSKSMKEFYKTPRGLERLEEMSRSAKEQWRSDPDFRRKALEAPKSHPFGRPVRYKNYYCRSQGEYETLLALEEIGATEIRQESLYIDYIDKDGQSRVYIPDFVCEFGEDKWILEVKYDDDSKDHHEKVSATLKYCRDNGYRFGWVRRFIEVPLILETRSLESCELAQL